MSAGLGSIQVLHIQQISGGGGLTSLADVADPGRGGWGVQDENADVINEQVLTRFIYHNEGFFNILNKNLVEDLILSFLSKQFSMCIEYASWKIDVLRVLS